MSRRLLCSVFGSLMLACSLSGCHSVMPSSCGACSFVSVLDPSAVYTNVAPHKMAVVPLDDLSMLIEEAYD